MRQDVHFPLCIIPGMYGYRLAFKGGEICDIVRDETDLEGRAVVWFSTMEAARDAKALAERLSGSVVA